MAIEFKQTARNGFETEIDGIKYMVSVHIGQFRIYTWINGEWDFDTPIPDKAANILAMEVSANYADFLA